jgi:hypothetical protein
MAVYQSALDQLKTTLADIFEKGVGSYETARNHLDLLQQMFMLDEKDQLADFERTKQRAKKVLGDCQRELMKIFSDTRMYFPICGNLLQIRLNITAVDYTPEKWADIEANEAKITKALETQGKKIELEVKKQDIEKAKADVSKKEAEVVTEMWTGPAKMAEAMAKSPYGIPGRAADVLVNSATQQSQAQLQKDKPKAEIEEPKPDAAKELKQRKLAEPVKPRLDDEL